MLLTVSRPIWFNKVIFDRISAEAYAEAYRKVYSGECLTVVDVGNFFSTFITDNTRLYYYIPSGNCSGDHYPFCRLIDEEKT